MAPVLIVWGYVCIYRRKEYVGGAPRGPRGRGRALGGGGPPPPRAPSFIPFRWGNMGPTRVVGTPRGVGAPPYLVASW